MAASIALSVRDLPTPLATTILHKLFSDDPSLAENRIRSLRPAALLLSLIAGGVTGSAIGRSGHPYIIVLEGCFISLAVIAVLEVLIRRVCCDTHAGQ